MADTRKDKRAPVSLKVRFKSATVDEFIEQYSKDLSRGGVFIKSKNPMSIGTLLKFEFQLKDESRLIHGVGRVVWRREPDEADAANPPGMGIKFIKMDSESRQTVQKIIDSRADEAATFEAGAEAGEQSSDAGSGGEQGFFPKGPSEAQLPAPEDRTSVRHASEFLASALADADDAAAAEAREGAEAARRRTEEIERERAQQRSRERSSKPPAGAQQDNPAVREVREAAEEAKETDEEKAAAVAKGTGAGSAAAAASGADETTEAPSAGTKGDVPATPEPAAAAAKDKAAPAGGGRGEAAADASAAAKDDEEPSAPPDEKPGGDPVDPLAATQLAGSTAEARSAESGSGAASDEPPRTPASEPSSPARPAAEPSTPPGAPEQQRSRMVPVALGLVAVAVVGYVLFDRFGGSSSGPPAAEVDSIEQTGADEPGDVAAAAGTAAEDSAAEGEDASTDTAAEADAVKVAIESTPSGATVRVDGEEVGTTPTEVGLAQDAKASIEVQQQGYATASRTVSADEVGDEPLRFELEALQYVLEVKTLPPRARVQAGGQAAASPAELVLDDVSGPVEVVARRPGYRLARRRVEADAFTEDDGALRASVVLRLAKAGGATKAAGGGGSGSAGGGASSGSGDEGSGGGSPSGGGGGDTGGSGSEPSGGGGEKQPPEKKPEPPKGDDEDNVPDNPF